MRYDGIYRIAAAYRKAVRAATSSSVPTCMPGGNACRLSCCACMWAMPWRAVKDCSDSPQGWGLHTDAWQA